MVVLKTQSEWGFAPPPQTPYSIISNLPGWDLWQNVRGGDASKVVTATHIYPRLAPTQAARALTDAIAQRLGLSGKLCMAYYNPMMWKYTANHVQHQLRKEHAITPDKLTFKAVDIAGHRLYTVLYDKQNGKALGLTWKTPGIGLSIRAAEYLLKNIDTMTEVQCSFDAPPEPTWTPEGPAHQQLRQRVVDLLHHGAIDPSNVTCKASDVFLYPTGMAAVFHSNGILEKYIPDGMNIEMGIVFHSTHELLYEDSINGWKHFGRVDTQSLDSMEAWLQAGNRVSYAIVEFPGNPTLESVDLHRLKALAETFNFVLIVDDTIGSASNIDVFALSDMTLTSLTKSFSGRADVLGGSVVLNPLSKHYNELSRRFSEAHHNELFADDAAVLLANSQDYFARSAILNANALGMAEFLHKSITDMPDSPVISVQYPSLMDSKANFDKFKRKSTAEMPDPGYGCLLTINFESLETAQAFYNNCGFYSSPHLAGHVTIMFPYNMLMFSGDPKEAELYRGYGAIEESIRISAGLEDIKDLVDTLQFALDKAIAAKKKGAAVAEN